MSGEVKPGAVVDVHLGALAAPTSNGKKTFMRSCGSSVRFSKTDLNDPKAAQPSPLQKMNYRDGSWPEQLQRAGRLCYLHFNHILGISGSQSSQKAASLDFSEPQLLFMV